MGFPKAAVEYTINRNKKNNQEEEKIIQSWQEYK